MTHGLNGGSFWTALAERSGDSAFAGQPRQRPNPKRHGAPLPAAVQNAKFRSGEFSSRPFSDAAKQRQHHRASD